MNPESVHTIVLGPSPSLREFRLYQPEVSLHHRVHHGYRWRGPEIGVEDCGLDVAAIPCGRNGFGEGRKVDVAVAHHAAGQQGIRGQRGDPVADLVADDALS